MRSRNIFLWLSAAFAILLLASTISYDLVFLARIVLFPVVAGVSAAGVYLFFLYGALFWLSAYIYRRRRISISPKKYVMIVLLCFLFGLAAYFLFSFHDFGAAGYVGMVGEEQSLNRLTQNHIMKAPLASGLELIGSDWMLSHLDAGLFHSRFVPIWFIVVEVMVFLVLLIASFLFLLPRASRLDILALFPASFAILKSFMDGGMLNSHFLVAFSFMVAYALAGRFNSRFFRYFIINTMISASIYYIVLAASIQPLPSISTDAIPYFLVRALFYSALALSSADLRHLLWLIPISLIAYISSPYGFEDSHLIVPQDTTIRMALDKTQAHGYEEIYSTKDLSIVQFISEDSRPIYSYLRRYGLNPAFSSFKAEDVNCAGRSYMKGFIRDLAGSGDGNVSIDEDMYDVEISHLEGSDRYRFLFVYDDCLPSRINVWAHLLSENNLTLLIYNDYLIRSTP